MIRMSSLLLLLSIHTASNTSMLFVPKAQRAIVVVDKTRLTSVRVRKIERPKTVAQLQKIVREAQVPISIIGAGYAQGGQIAYPDGLAIDMTFLNTITNLDVHNKRITVQAGATWKAVQRCIDPHNLSVRVMQSYNDFTVGGELGLIWLALVLPLVQLLIRLNQLKLCLPMAL